MFKVKKSQTNPQDMFGHAFENIYQKLFLKYFSNVFKNKGMF